MCINSLILNLKILNLCKNAFKIPGLSKKIVMLLTHHLYVNKHIVYKLNGFQLYICINSSYLNLNCFTGTIKREMLIFKNARYIALILFTVLIQYGNICIGQINYSFKIAKLKYGGSGDWYANKTALPNLFEFIRKNTRMNIFLEEEIVEPSSPKIFQYPMVYMTGHGNVEFSTQDVENLRKYLISGGFLLADDNYGMHKYIMREAKKLFPEHTLVELPFTHPIFKMHYPFENGLPKIHEHDGKPPQGFGIIHEGRLVLLITYECDLGDGWEDPAVHNDPEEIRQKALKMGANIVQYVLTH